MKNIKHLLFLSILCSLVLFTNCGDEDNSIVPTDDSDIDNADDETLVYVYYTLTLTASV